MSNQSEILAGFTTFCGDIFWDSDNFFNASLPSFTVCFQHTVLVLIPVLFFWLFVPLFVFQLYLEISCPLPHSFINSTKFILALFLTIDAVFVLATAVYEYFNDENPNPVDFVYPFLLMITMLTKCLFIVTCRLRGKVTSGILFLSWCIFGISGIPEFFYWLHQANNVQTLAVIDMPRYVAYLVWFPLIWLQVFLFCFADRRQSYNDEHLDNPSPEMHSSFVNRMLYLWFDRIPRKGIEKPLEIGDLFNLNETDQSHYLVPRWNALWNRAMKDYYQRKRNVFKKIEKVDDCTPILNEAEKRSHYGSFGMGKAEDSRESTVKLPSIVWRLFRIFWKDFLGATLVKILSDVIQFVNPQLLGALIGFTQDLSIPLWMGVFMAFGLFISSELRSFFLNQYFYLMFRMGTKVQTVLTAAIYEKVVEEEMLVKSVSLKSLKLSNEAKRKKTIGEIVNLMAIDVDRFQQITPQIQQFWSSPFQISLSLYFLWQTLGPSVLAGIFVMLIITPMNVVVSFVIKKWQTKQMRLKDERMLLVNEMLNGIKVIKLYAWEKSIEKKISTIRDHELALIKYAFLLRNIADIANIASPFLVALVTFTTFVLVDPENNLLTPQIAFVSLTLFNMLQSPMFMVADLINQTVQAIVSNRRLKEFLTADELDQFNVDRRFNDQVETISIENGSFCWDNNQLRPTLNAINLRIIKGKFVAVVGKVGAGKSSLLSALLGEMNKLDGHAVVQGKVAYVPQQSWIQNLTLRENIVFGRPFYDQVLDSCALLPDIAILPAGDMTEIGEKGINLSGGQKMRVSLARAVYHNDDVYMLDDPLSAVDSHVGRHIFDHVLGPNGMLKNRTRLLATHRLDRLNKTDLVVVINDGLVIEIGPFEQLLNNEGVFSELIEELRKHEKYDQESGKSTPNEISEKICADFEQNDSGRLLLMQQRSTVSSLVGTGSSASILKTSKRSSVSIREENLPIKDKLVKFTVYGQYFKSMSTLLGLGFLLGLITNTGFQMGRNIWLSAWSNDAAETATEMTSVWFRLGIYGFLGFSEVAMMGLSMTSLVYGGMLASRNLHWPLVRNLLRSPMSFFDTTPTGRILNRLGKDIEVIDLRLPSNFRFFIVCLLRILAVIIIIVMSTPLFAFVIVPLAIVYLYLLRYFIATSRQLKRLESITRSPIYSHFGESIQGASSIRAYNLMAYSCRKSQHLVDEHIRCKYLNLISNRWLSVRLEFIGNLIILLAAIFAVLARDWGSINAGVIGLSISYSLNITLSMNFAIRMISELESNIVSVERVKEYTETPTEASWDSTPNLTPSRNWPDRGNVRFEEYSCRHRPDLDLVIKEFNADIRPGEKVAIVGRTGAGKSSMVLSLFRIIEGVAGKIIIDGLDISSIGLHDLRSNLTIIPQDPVLFSGTLRFNLDPFERYFDSELWMALDHAHLKSFVAEQTHKLYHQMCEGGENLSVGQRQLVCLSRAILRKSKVLILDEATAAVDLTTDSLIQATIRTEFTNCTVLTIAHRLNTILDYDRVMVLDRGRIVEFESPSNLLADRNSRFFAMAKDANLVSRD